MNFEISLKDLCEIFSLYQNKSETNRGAQLKLMEKRGGDKYLLHGLFTHANKGIRKLSIEERVQYYGSNAQPVQQVKSFWKLVWEALSDFTLRVLIVAAILSIILEESVATGDAQQTGWIEGVSILLAVMICATVTAVNNYQKEKQFQKLNHISQNRKVYSVIRESETAQINQNEIVTGDILIVREGMEVPVDGWLLNASEVSVDESSMTGESEPVSKSTLQECLTAMKRSSMKDVPSTVMISGTKVLSGEGKMICLVVGNSSCIGHIRSLVEERGDRLTPLQAKLEKLASDIGKFGLYSAIIIVLILLIRFTIERVKEHSWVTSIHLPELLNYFITGITVVVVAIPEGLPLAVTLTLAYSVKKMLLDNNLVRRMQACETMGGASVICSDKTGTLTVNKMNVTVWWNDGLHEVQPHSESRLNYYKFMHQQYQQLLQVNLFINGSAELRPEHLGSSTEIALMIFGERISGKYNKFREDYPVVRRYPFNSNRKRMSILIEVKDKSYLMTKGASEIVLNGCTAWLNSKTMEAIPIKSELRNQLEDIIVKMAEKGLRTIVLACRQVNPSHDINLKNQSGVYQIESEELVLMAIFGVRDLPREEVPDAISQCRRAGIKVKMITGDNLVTATAIAKEIGIIQPHKPSLCLEGPEFNRIIGGIVCSLCRTEKCGCSTNPNDKTRPLRKDVIKNEEDFERLIKNLDVLARSRPQDKYALVTGLINKGIVVAVTGDGTNDAPALKKADVGFAMGKCGTQIAREASSIVLLDDNFNSIVKAVLWGRNIYDSIKKFVQFQITVNVVAVSTTLIGALVLRQNILTPIQMLWLNMIMDTLASLALATEPPTESLLDRKPHSREEYIITKRMWKHIIAQSIYQLLVVLLTVFLGEHFIPESPDDFDVIITPNMQYKYFDGVVDNGFVVSGRLFEIFSSTPSYQTIYDQFKVPSRHFTVVFNTFVMMQIFNFFNCRKLYDELNVFQGITRNWIFSAVLLLIFCLQIIIVTFGSVAFSLYSFYGLTLIQWLICIGFGSGSLIISILTKLIPESEMCMDRVDSDMNAYRVNRSYLLALKPKEQPVDKTTSSESDSDKQNQHTKK